MAGPRCTLSCGARASGRLWQLRWLDGSDREGVDATKSIPNQLGELLRVDLIIKGDKISTTHFGPNQKILVSTQVGHIFMLDLNSNRYRRIGRFGRVSCLALDIVEGMKALVGLEEEGEVLVLDCGTGAVKGRLSHPGSLVTLAFSEGGKLGLGMGRTEATVWDVQKCVSVHRLQISEEGGSLCCVGLVGGLGEFKYRIVSSNTEGQVTVWGVPRGGSELQVINQFGEQRQCEAAQTKGQTIFIGWSGGGVSEYNVESGDLLCVTPTPSHLALTGLQVVDKLLVLEHEGGLAFVEVGSGNLLKQVEGGGGGEAQVSPCLRLMARITEGALLLYKLGSSVARINSKNSQPNACVDVPSKEVDSQCSNYKPSSLKPVQPPSKSLLNLEEKKTANKPSKAEAESILNNVTREKLLPMLKCTGDGFPPRHREFIWSKLLHLPRNKKCFGDLVKLGPHPAITSLPPPSTDESSVILSALLHWSPSLSLLPYMQQFLSPFANLFSRHPRAGFEVCLSVLHNYCHDWWRDVPRPPPTTREAWQLLSTEDSYLATHLQSVGCDVRSCVWPLLQTGWSSVLPPTAWSTLWDHLVVGTPAFLPPALVATLITLREDLLKCSSSLQVFRLLSSRQTVQVQSLLKIAYKIQEKQAKADLEYQKLHVGSYPKPIELENEKEILAGEQAAGSKIYLPTVDQKYANEKIMNALKISPPPLPRIAHNVNKAEGKAKTERQKPKQVLGQIRQPNFQSEPVLPNFDEKSSRPSVVGGSTLTPNPMDPLLPRYTTSRDEQTNYPSNIENKTPDGIEDVVLLLDKAKFIRNLVSAK